MVIYCELEARMLGDITMPFDVKLGWLLAGFSSYGNVVHLELMCNVLDGIDKVNSLKSHNHLSTLLSLVQ